MLSIAAPAAIEKDAVKRGFQVNHRDSCQVCRQTVFPQGTFAQLAIRRIREETNRVKVGFKVFNNYLI